MATGRCSNGSCVESVFGGVLVLESAQITMESSRYLVVVFIAKFSDKFFRCAYYWDLKPVSRKQFPS